MSTIEEGVCEICGSGVHVSEEGQDLGEPGRLSCDGCNRPTIQCTCEGSEGSKPGRSPDIEDASRA